MPFEASFWSASLWKKCRWVARTLKVGFLKLLEILGLYRCRTCIIALPALATTEAVAVQAVAFHGLVDDIIGFRPQRLLQYIFRGMPQLRHYLRLSVRMELPEGPVPFIDVNMRRHGFVSAWVLWPRPLVKPPEVQPSWMVVEPQGIETLWGPLSLGDFEVIQAPVFFLHDKIK